MDGQKQRTASVILRFLVERHLTSCYDIGYPKNLMKLWGNFLVYDKPANTPD